MRKPEYLNYVNPNTATTFFRFRARLRDGIDILAVSDADRYVLRIENKVRSGEHDNQLAWYRRAIAETYPGFRARFVYLTPDCAEASDPEHWIPMGYADMLEIIDSVSLDDKVYR